MTTNTQPKTTLVLGGTGKTGRRVAARLAALDLPVRIGSRNGEPAFDWDDSDTWAPALHGAGAMYLAYVPDVAVPGAAETVGALARLAVDHGVSRIVLLSGRGEPEAERAEDAVRRSGAALTILRSAFFAQNFNEGFWLDAVLSGEFAFPAGDVAEPLVDVDDIADVAVAAFTDDRHIGQVYELTGPRLLTFADAVHEISQATGHEVRYRQVSIDEYAALALADGAPPDIVDLLTDLFRQVLDGRNAHLADGVQRALGRLPRDFADYARDAASSGVWEPSLTTGA